MQLSNWWDNRFYHVLRSLGQIYMIQPVGQLAGQMIVCSVYMIQFIVKPIGQHSCPADRTTDCIVFYRVISHIHMIQPVFQLVC